MLIYVFVQPWGSIFLPSTEFQMRPLCVDGHVTSMRTMHVLVVLSTGLCHFYCSGPQMSPQAISEVLFFHFLLALNEITSVYLLQTFHRATVIWRSRLCLQSLWFKMFRPPP